MSELQGARSVVTGAGGGLGRAFAEALGARRGKLLVSDIDLALAEATAARVRELGGEAEAMRCDVRQAAEVEALAARMDERFGGTDLVINNAGVAVSGLVGEVSLEDWRWILDINLLGVIHGCHSFIPRFRRAGSGYVINVASAAGLVSLPTMAPYNATKAAVVALSEALRGEVSHLGIHVTVLCPTFFVTNIIKAGRGPGDPRDAEEATRMMERSRLQAPDVARAALKAVAKDQLYCVPMLDGRLAWRLKRLWPALFGTLTAAEYRRRLKR